MAPETRRAGRDQIAPVSQGNSIGAPHTAQDQENPRFIEQDEDEEDRAKSSNQAALGVNTLQTHADRQPSSGTSST
jgi:hypothetical protein